MSLVYITFHDENIADIEKDLTTITEKREKYTSKFNKQRKVRSKTEAQLDIINAPGGEKILTGSVKSSHKTMGYDVTPPSLPCNFLRKNGGVKWRRLREHTCPKTDKKMPSVPRLEDINKERELIICEKTKNFRKLNIDLVKKSAPKVPPPQYIDQPTGTPRPLKNTGLMPQYACSEKYGKVPPYLKKRKQELKETKERCEAEKKAYEEKCLEESTTVKKMPAEERAALLNGLKQKWAAVFKTYMSGSLITDTMAKRIKVAKLEMELRQLEADIFLIESNQSIYYTL